MQYLGGGIGHRESSAKAEIPNNVDAEGDNEPVTEDGHPPSFASSVAVPIATTQDEDIPVDVVGDVTVEGEGDVSRSRKRKRRRKGPTISDPSQGVDDDADD